MFVLGISASPKKGITESLLDKALEGAAFIGCVTEKIVLARLNYKACQDCGGCRDTGVCILRDDMTRIYDKLIQADAVIVASPIFFGSITAQLKAVIDRCQCIWVSRYVKEDIPSRTNRSRGLFICASGADKESFFRNAKEIVRIFFATNGIEYWGELFLGGHDLKTPAEVAREGYMQKAFSLGVEIGKNA